MSASVKAGLIGAAASVVLALLGLIQCLACITPILGLALYVGVGVLAAYWLAPPRTVSAGAGAGAIAALITSLVSGVVSMIISAIQFAITGGAQTAAAFSQIPPEMMEQLGETGAELMAFMATIGGVLIVSSVCCVIGLAIAAGLGAIGGAIMASIKSD